MCMIAFRPVEPGKAGANIPNSVIDAAMTRHPDGFGVAWREVGEDGTGELKVAKYGPSRSERKQFRKMLKRVDASRYEYVAHFRFGTQGPNDQAHAHPFEYMDPIEGRVLVFHNGIVDIKATEHESDTEVFVGAVLATLPSRWWADPAIVWLVEQSTGWSKFTVMTATETVSIRESSGTWDGGLWYSSSHKPSVYVQKFSDDAWWEKNGYVKDATGAGGWRYVGDGKVVGIKSAKESAGVLIGAASAEISTDRIVYRDVDKRRQLRHGGHNVTALQALDYTQDGEYMSGIVCDTCSTQGDVYLIDGSAYIDMAHKDTDGAETDPHEEEAIAGLLPATTIRPRLALVS